MEERIVVGLDIGTTKICAIVASINEMEKINILGVGKAPSEGLNRGVVVNIEKTVNAIRDAVGQAELASGMKVNAVNVGVAGDHIRSLRSKGVITINNSENEITQHDVDRLLEDCQRIMLPTDQQILHVIPQEFIVDGQDGIINPVGMNGMRMEAEVQIITGLVSATKNLKRCVERAGYQVADIILEPLGSSLAVLDDDEREAGVVLVDIGGGTTDIAIFQKDVIRHTAVVAIAGNKVTDDIRIGLSILEDQVIKIKHQFGIAYEPLIEDVDEIIKVPGISGRPEKEIKRSVLAQIIQPRMEEILEIVAIEIKRSGYENELSAGVVFTGGGSLIEGLCQLANIVLGMEAKVGMPRGLSGGLVNEVNNPIYATSIGLVIHALKNRTAANPKLEELLGGSSRSNLHQTIDEIKTKMKNWFKEF